MNLYDLNDLLTAHLAGTDIDDDTLNNLTHDVANAINNALTTRGYPAIF